MATIAREWKAAEEVVAAQSSSEIPYLVFDAADELEALAALEATPATHRGMPRRSTRLGERAGDKSWRAVVSYAPYERRYSATSFEIGSSTQHITQSLQTVGAYAVPGATAPNHARAIGWDGEKVQGVDINVPVYTFSETHYKNAGDVDANYRATVFGLCETVNNNTWRGFAQGELLFLGMSGMQRDSNVWELSYKFAASPNKSGISIGAITGISKRGWEYLWTQYRDFESGGVLIKRPYAAYVERVYSYGNFFQLGI